MMCWTCKYLNYNTKQIILTEKREIIWKKGNFKRVTQNSSISEVSKIHLNILSVWENQFSHHPNKTLGSLLVHFLPEFLN